MASEKMTCVFVLLIMLGILMMFSLIYSDVMKMREECGQACENAGMHFGLVQGSIQQRDMSGINCRCQSMDNGTLVEKWMAR